MVEFNQLLPIGSVVKLKKEKKLLVIIGIIQQDEEADELYDYAGVLYPEGNVEQYMFNHDMIENVVFRGYEDSERDVFIQSLELETTRATEQTNQNIIQVLTHLYETRDVDNYAILNIEAIVDRFGLNKSDIKDSVEFLIKDEYIEQKKMSRNKYHITQKGLDIFVDEQEKE